MDQKGFENQVLVFFTILHVGQCVISNDNSFDIGLVVSMIEARGMVRMTFSRNLCALIETYALEHVQVCQ